MLFIMSKKPKDKHFEMLRLKKFPFSGFIFENGTRAKIRKLMQFTAAT